MKQISQIEIFVVASLLSVTILTPAVAAGTGSAFVWPLGFSLVSMQFCGVPPFHCSGWSVPYIEANYTNNFSQNLTAIVYCVVQNNLNQTIYYSTATISPPSGGSQVAYLVVFGLPQNNTYVAKMYAISASGGVVVSTTSSITFVI